MKKLVTLGFVLILAGIIFYQKDTIVSLVDNLNLFNKHKEVVLGEKNEYYRDYDFEYVQNTDNFSPSCFQDIINIYYTVINSGNSNFTFYCPKEYDGCIEDIKTLANDQTMLSDINNFVHPYNSFQHVETEYDDFGRISIKIRRSYTQEEITAVNEKINYIVDNVLNSDYPVEENIRLAHDYIIENSQYDSRRSDSQIVEYKSDIAYGPLIEGYGICGGYTDAMELILEALKVKSYRVSSDNHIWNAIYLNDNWSHVDLTWDDPVISDGSQVVDHNFFIIDTATLLKLESNEHNFNQNVYFELKQ